MIIYIIKWVILYTLLIYLLHNLYLYFSDLLTENKEKDYLLYTNKEYNNIYSIINQNQNQNQNINQNQNQNQNQNINQNQNFDQNINIDNMKNELTDFLNGLNN